ncbi:sensor histidine kinase [Pseudonocardia sp. TRM90224]|uniref:sensor histidine kinase n=1 Tax=Pseudonocardia sp. TRM90224 TaxID=2812678 RepID=UPI001E5EBAC8|nr:ATP-binding protein [Pseudonocardia sp. TRM90224]
MTEPPALTVRSAACAVVALPVLWAAVAARPGRFAPWEAVGALAVLALALWLASRLPIVALVVAMGAWLLGYLPRAQVDSTMGIGVLAAGLATVAFLAGRHAVDSRHGAAAIAAGSTVSGAAAVAVTSGADAALLAGATTLLLTAVPWSVGRYRRRFAELVAAGWERAEQLETAAEQARARERALLAGEMHDLIGHELATAALQVGALELDPALAERQRAAAAGARRSVTAAAERLADAVRVLRSAPADPAGSLADLVERSRTAGLDVELDGVETGLGPLVASTVRRVVAESLTNAIKHAPGAAVTVSVGIADSVHVRVENSPPERPVTTVMRGGHGLVGLSERLRLVGGTFGAGPRPDGGFVVVAELPSTPAVPEGPPAVAHRELAEARVQRSARTAVLVAVCATAAIGAGVLGWMVFDAATSVLHPADFARVTVGQSEASLAGVLPWRTRVDDPAGVPPGPPGSVCRHYSTHTNPFDPQRHELYRLCFRGGRVVSAELLERGG